MLTTYSDQNLNTGNAYTNAVAPERKQPNQLAEATFNRETLNRAAGLASQLGEFIQPVADTLRFADAAISVVKSLRNMFTKEEVEEEYVVSQQVQQPIETSPLAEESLDVNTFNAQAGIEQQEEYDILPFTEPEDDTQQEESLELASSDGEEAYSSLRAA